MKLLPILAFALAYQGSLLAAVSIDPVTGIDMGDTKISSVESPTLPNDAATKEYVDTGIELSEVRMPIDSLPINITSPGSYYVTGNLDGSGGGIDILTDNVTLDLMGFTLDGGGAIDDPGIDLDGRSNVSIRNGTITGFGRAGIYQGSDAAGLNRAIDIKVLGNGFLGVFDHIYDGIHLNGTNSLIYRCVGEKSGYFGLHANMNALIVYSTASKNGSSGIVAYEGATLLGNTSYDNGGDGLYGGNGSTISDNAANGNKFKGIFTGTGTTVTNNTANSNGSWGIKSPGASTVKGNTAHDNNTDETPGQGGIYVGNNSLTIGNTVNFNHETGIFVEGTDNVLRDNHVTDSQAVATISQCIYFQTDDNVAIGNTATGCTANFAGAVIPPARFVGNIDW